MYSDEVTASPQSSIGSDRPVPDVESSSGPSVRSSPPPLNISELSYLTAEHAPADKMPARTVQPRVDMRASADTDAVAQQLQAALGIADEVDDSFDQCEEEEEEHDRQAVETVAGRIALLENCVSRLTHTVRSLSRNSSPERAASSARTPATGHDSEHQREHGHGHIVYSSAHGSLTSGIHSVLRASQSPGASVVQAAAPLPLPLQQCEERIHELEDKVDHMMRVLEERRAAGLLSGAGGRSSSSTIGDAVSTGTPTRSAHTRPPQPPPPLTPPPLPTATTLNATNAANDTAEAERLRGTWTNRSTSYTSISNVTSNSKGRSHGASTAQGPSASSVPVALSYADVAGAWGSSNSAVSSSAAGGASLQDMEQLLRRVLRERSPDVRSARTSDISPVRGEEASPSVRQGQTRRTASRNSARSHSPATRESRRSREKMEGRNTSGSALPGHGVWQAGNRHESSRDRSRGESAERRRRALRRSSRHAEPSLDADSDSSEISGSSSVESVSRVTVPHMNVRDEHVLRYVSSNAEKLLLRQQLERSRKVVQQEAAKRREGAELPSVRARYEALALAAREGLAADRVQLCAQGAEESGSSDSGSEDDIPTTLLGSDGDSSSDARPQRPHAESRPRHSGSSSATFEVGSGQKAKTRPTVKAVSALDKNIFDLLKVKYGLQAVGGTEQADEGLPQQRNQLPALKSHGVAVRRSSGSMPVSRHAASLPMRVSAAESCGPADPSVAAVVDWGQYVHNRVASRSASPAVPASPLRPGTPGVYTVAGVVVNCADNIDVLPRAKHDQRLSRRASQGQRELIMGSLTHDEISAKAHAAAKMLVPADFESDADFAALVRQLHAKVLARTIKEAQYDILRMNEGSEE